MSYQINKTDGTILATVADGQIDDQSTDITLIGKNYSGFGEALNENFVKLLENFSGTSEPVNPVAGQVWFDASELKLKVYSGTTFLPVSSATISSDQPETLGVGDLWYNDADKQLYFFDGSAAVLLGPDFTETQGLSGLKVESILDTLNQTRVITLLYTNGILLGIFAKDTFTPKNPIAGFTGDIQPGFNAGNLQGIKFDVTCTNSEQLGGSLASNYVRKDTANQINGQLSINDNLGIVVGDAGQGNLSVKGTGDVFLSNSASDKKLVLEVRRGIVAENAVEVDSGTRVVSFYKDQENSTVDVGGDLLVNGDFTLRGNLIVNDGDVTQVKTSELVIEDKIMVLGETGDSAQNTDENASGGGLILKGASNHILLWSDTGQAGTAEFPALASQAWTSSEHVNLASGKEFKIDGVTVLSGNSLGPGITSIPGVTSFGPQNIVRIGPGVIPVIQTEIEDNQIRTIANDDDLELAPDGTGNVALIGSPKITGLADPSDPQDASTKEYVDNTIQLRPIVLSIDLSDAKPNSYIINNILNAMCPVSEFRNGSFARILCNIISNSTTQLDINPLVNESTATFNTPTGTAPAVTNVSVSQATVSSPTISTTRIIKEFQILGGSWSFVGETILPP
jgi:hypothetical protein